MKLDYSLESPQERKTLVEQILQENPQPTPAYLEILANYLILSMEKQEKKILTENRLKTINERETSYEGLASCFQNGEDGVANLVSDNRNAIFRPRTSITEADLQEVPSLAQLRQDIYNWERSAQTLEGRDAYLARRALIEMRKDQYLLKKEWRQPINFVKLTRCATPPIELEDTSYLDGDRIIIQGVSLMDSRTVAAILQNYSRLMQDSWGQFNSDLYCIMREFDEVAAVALADEPIANRLIELKIDGVSSQQICDHLQQEFNVRYSPEYISTLWNTRIPRLIAICAQEKFARTQGLPEKTCGRCGQAKPASTLFFHKNSTSPDGFYSICKKCRKEMKKNGK